MGCSFVYAYALDGNQLSKIDADGDLTEYVYDKLGRLVDESATEFSIVYIYVDWVEPVVFELPD